MPLKDAVSILRKHAKFADLSDQELSAIIALAKTESYKKGDTIIKERSHGDKLFIILEGEVAISKNISSQVMFFITNLQPGDMFGEMALMSNFPRSANAQATAKTTLATIDQKSFLTLRDENPVVFGKLTFAISQVVSERLYKLEERLSRILNATLSD